MFVPYMTAVPPYYSMPIGPIPMGYLPNGLSHAGIPLQTNPWYINPLQQMQQQIPYGYGTYGFRPQVPYGYGLSHAGLGYENPYGIGLGYGYGPQPHLPAYGAPIQSPLQPNWSPIAGIPQQPPV